MRRVVLALALAAFSAPASAQTADQELKDFAKSYVDLFNKGDVATLARDYYAVPGVSTGEMEQTLAKRLADLRANEFGKMTLYAAKPCAPDADKAALQMDFAYNFTYGGVMDPGDQSTVFQMAKSDAGWRITGSNDLKAGQGMVCAL